jgi:hypothetical protein
MMSDLQIHSKYNDWKEGIVDFRIPGSTWRLLHKDMDSILVPLHIGWYWKAGQDSYSLCDEHDDKIMLFRNNWIYTLWSVEIGRKIWTTLLEMGFEVV